MILPIFPKLSRAPGALGEWIKGRNATAREREDRETAHTMSLDLQGDGGIWLDRDGRRTRLIVRPGSSQGANVGEQLSRIEPLFQLEHGDDLTPR